MAGSPSRAPAVPPEGGFARLVGHTGPMAPVIAALQKAAGSESTILLYGETGTGKEACAEAVHGASPRRKGPLVVVDCSAIAPTLIESELFGHERGAFTGASAARPGALEAANGGTVFLDEIGELPLEMQPKLLRALERHEVRRLGSNAYRSVDVRVLAATNRDLRSEVAAGRFRSDLFFRLAVVTVRLPPLRERLGDLPALVDMMLAVLRADVATAAACRTPAFLEALARYQWPGNIRELRNHVERCVALGEFLPPQPAAPERPPEEEVDLSVPFRRACDAHLWEFERRYVVALLRKHGDNVSAAARAADLDRVQLYRLMAKHGITPRETPADDLVRTVEIKIHRDR